MKHILLICSLLFFMVACEEDKSVDPTVMPQETMSGENTFGCLIDGWVYVSGRWDRPTTEFTERNDSTFMTIVARVGFDSSVRFTIVNPKQDEIADYTEASFDNQELEDGKVHITRMDNGIISGTFEGSRMIEGRFDLKYKE